ncbi:MAG: hypothetical protein PVI30_27395 [Myxococcales bacterium]|jgi:hypothetical protein
MNRWCSRVVSWWLVAAALGPSGVAAAQSNGALASEPAQPPSGGGRHDAGTARRGGPLVAADLRMGLLLPPGLWAAGVRLRPAPGTTFAVYGAAGLTLACEGCVMVGAEATGLPSGDDDGLYLALGVAYFHESSDQRGMVIPFTLGHQWQLAGTSLRLGGGLSAYAPIEEPDCELLCIDFLPPVLPYLELVASFWLL